VIRTYLRVMEGRSLHYSAEYSRDGAILAAERFRLAIKETEWSERPVTASFGVATSTRSIRLAPN